MRRAGLVVLPILALVTACATKAAETRSADKPAVLEEPADAPAQNATYTCENGVKLDVTFEASGDARVKTGALDVELPAVIAASGNKFSNGRYTLWTKGMDEAMWIVGRMAPTQCAAPAQ